MHHCVYWVWRLLMVGGMLGTAGAKICLQQKVSGRVRCSVGSKKQDKSGPWCVKVVYV